MVQRIKGGRSDTVLNGREVSVYFTSPVRFRVIENGKDVTKDFHNGKLEFGTVEFEQFHAQVRDNERSQVLFVVR